MNSLIKQHIEKALDAVSDTPEEYRKIAFRVVLDHLLASTETPEKTTKQEITRVKPQNIDAVLKSEFDWSGTKILQLKPSLQNLYILKITKDKFGIDGLTPSEIQTILFQKFRITKTSNAISMSLMAEVGRHIDRIQHGREFRYRITADGVSHLTRSLEKTGIV